MIAIVVSFSQFNNMQFSLISVDRPIPPDKYWKYNFVCFYVTHTERMLSFPQRSFRDSYKKFIKIIGLGYFFVVDNSALSSPCIG